MLLHKLWIYKVKWDKVLIGLFVLTGLTVPFSDISHLDKAASGSTIAEEAPGSCKDVDEVIKASDSLGVEKEFVKMRPIVNIKG